jgi:hypothetical protein
MHFNIDALTARLHQSLERSLPFQVVRGYTTYSFLEQGLSKASEMDLND